MTQHIDGYRVLSEREVDLVNSGRLTAAMVDEFITRLEMSGIQLDGRALALARTNLQQGFMWLTRAITKPTTFG